MRLVVNSVLTETDGALRGLVGGALSYGSLELAWGWVLLFYALLAFAVLPARGAPEDAALPEGGLPHRLRRGGAGLRRAGRGRVHCVTPVRYETIYGFQGRYLLPAAAAGAAGVRPAAHPGGGRRARGRPS